MNKSILNIAAVAIMTAFINSPALAQQTEQIECTLYPGERYAPAEKGTTIEETSTACVARYTNVRPDQVKVIAVDHDADEVLVSVIFSNSTKTFLVVRKELAL